MLKGFGYKLLALLLHPVNKWQRGVKKVSELSGQREDKWELPKQRINALQQNLNRKCQHLQILANHKNSLRGYYLGPKKQEILETNQ